MSFYDRASRFPSPTDYNSALRIKNFNLTYMNCNQKSMSSSLVRDQEGWWCTSLNNSSSLHWYAIYKSTLSERRRVKKITFVLASLHKQLLEKVGLDLRAHIETFTEFSLFVGCAK